MHYAKHGLKVIGTLSQEHSLIAGLIRDTLLSLSIYLSIGPSSVQWIGDQHGLSVLDGGQLFQMIMLLTMVLFCHEVALSVTESGIRKDEHGQLQYNVGLKMTAEEVGAEISRQERRDGKIDYAVLDPSAFAHSGGESIEEMLVRGAGKNMLWRRADNTRVSKKGAMGGWNALRQRLIGESIERPMLVVFDTCIHTVRTVPVLQHDSHNIEDIDTDGEDHAADEIRYACMSRPWTRDNPSVDLAKYPLHRTFDQLVEEQGRKRASETY